MEKRTAGHRTGSARPLPGSGARTCAVTARESRPAALTRPKLSQLHFTHILIRIKRLCELCRTFRCSRLSRRKSEKTREKERKRKRGERKREEERWIKRKRERKRVACTQAFPFLTRFLRARCRFYRSDGLISHDARRERRIDPRIILAGEKNERPFDAALVKWTR